MLVQTEPGTVIYMINDLVDKGYMLTYIRTGEYLEKRKIIICGGYYRVEVDVKSPKTYEVNFYVEDKNLVKMGVKPFIKLDDYEFSSLKNILRQYLPGFISWAYDEDSFTYVFSKTTNKIVKVV